MGFLIFEKFNNNFWKLIWSIINVLAFKTKKKTKFILKWRLNILFITLLLVKKIYSYSSKR